MNVIYGLNIHCVRCRMSIDYCFCDIVRPIPAATQVVLVMHYREMGKISNTGRLAEMALSDCRTELHGKERDIGRVLPPFPSDRQTYVLYPSEDAPLLSREEVAVDGRPVTLVVPDGTWRQAKKMPRRIPALAELPRRRLPAGPPSDYRLRDAPHDGQLATCEAVCRALDILEGPEVSSALNDLFLTMVQRTLDSRRWR